MTEHIKDLLSASLLIVVLYLTTTTATDSTSSVTHSGQHTMSRQSSNTDNLPLRAMAPIRISTLAATKHSVSTAVLGAQDRGNAAHLPSALSSDRIHQQIAASDPTELSESEQHVLQHLGWSPAGRRGLEPGSASPVRTSPSKSSGATALKHFWKHFTGLYWLVSQEQPLVQHDMGLTAGQHAKQEAFKLAQPVLQRAATDTLYLQSKRHIDVVTPKTARSSQQHEPSAGHMVTKRSGSDKLLHVGSNQDSATTEPHIPVPPQHAQGAQGQDNTVVRKESTEQFAQPLSESVDDHTGDFIEWPSDDHLDDDMATAHAGIPAEQEDASIALEGSSSGLPQLQSLAQMAQDQLPKPAKYEIESDAQPQADLAHAKQAFAQYLTGVHGHPDIHE